MAKGVFIHNEFSVYDDLPEERYEFPATYLKRAEDFVGDWVLYYESGKNSGRQSYKAIAKVKSIVPSKTQGRYYALMQTGTFIEFENLVPFRIDGKLSNSFLANNDGSANSGRQVWAVRPIPEEDFVKIVNIGLPDHSEELPRTDEMEVHEEQVPLYEEKQIVEIKLNKKLRDRAFRHNVLKAYDRRCAFTGLRFINGGGRAEVQAAHIKPVEEDGPDTIRNGIALSGTAHWMFDRGLLSLSDDFGILVSRHINNIDEVNRILVKDRKALVPNKQSVRPHKTYLEWHRCHRFKT